VVVICPKCKTKLRVDETKIAGGGSRFKCPKCSTSLLVKKPAPVAEKTVSADNIKVIVAHSNAAIAKEIISLLSANGFQAITAVDGIEAMVKSLKDRPFLAVIEVGLPKIYGVEVCKRLKGRPETKGMKFILISSPFDKNRYRREPESFYEADDHIEEHRIAELLMSSVNALKGGEPRKKEEAEERKEEKIEQPVPEQAAKGPEIKPEPAAPMGQPLPGAATLSQGADEKIERAKRLARTIVSDIYLYNTAKAEESIKNNTFTSAFASEIKEGLKLYENRIPREVREKSDFFREVLTTFIENKKKAL
jgi:predicted Zn finger-like uncharacterized protein